MRYAAASGPAMPGRFELIVLLGELSTFGPPSIDMYLRAFRDLQAHFATSARMVQVTPCAYLRGLVGQLDTACGGRRPLVVDVAGHALVSSRCALAPLVEGLIAFRLQGRRWADGMLVALAMFRQVAMPAARRSACAAATA